MAARYNLTEIRKFQEQNHSLTQIAAYYHVTRQSLTSWLKRQGELPIRALNNRQPKRKKLLVKQKSIQHEPRPLDLDPNRLPKYGQIPPTGYISDLDNHQWILHYFPRYHWDYPELKAYRNTTDDRTIRLMHREAGKSVSDVGIYTREFL